MFVVEERRRQSRIAIMMVETLRRVAPTAMPITAPVGRDWWVGVALDAGLDVDSGVEEALMLV